MKRSNGNIIVNVLFAIRIRKTRKISSCVFTL